MRIFPTDKERKQLELDSGQFRWYYNAYLDIFNMDQHRQEIQKCREENKLPKKLNWRIKRDELKNWDYIENVSDQLVFCALVPNKEKMAKQTEKDAEYKKIREDRRKRKNLKEEKIEEHIIKKNKSRDMSEFPGPKWLYENNLPVNGNKTYTRIIRGACANFYQNLNSVTTHFYKGNISQINIYHRTAKDGQNLLYFTDSAIPAHMKKIKGSYSYRCPPNSENKRRTKISWQNLIKEHSNKPITIVGDNQTKQWFAMIPVPREWYPADDCRRENQARTVPGKAIALDPGMRKFLTGYDTEGVVLLFGDKDYRELTNKMFQIDRIDRIISKSREKEKKLSEEMIKDKKELWARIKNMVRDLHWKTANYLVKNYEYIFIEDFRPSQILKNQNLPGLVKRVINQYAFYQFKSRLIYLCEKYKCKLILVHPALTTKCCSACGAINKPEKFETYNCLSCQFSYDRDVNSAKNVLIKGLTVLRETC